MLARHNKGQGLPRRTRVVIIRDRSLFNVLRRYTL